MSNWRCLLCGERTIAETRPSACPCGNQTFQKMIPLLCRFCEAQTGEYAVPTLMEGLDIPPEDLGYVDSRCESCQGVHGTVQEAERIIEEKLSDVGGVDDTQKREILEASGWSLPDVVTEASAERERRIEEQEETEGEGEGGEGGGE